MTCTSKDVIISSKVYQKVRKGDKMKKVEITLTQVGNEDGSFISQNELTVKIGQWEMVSKDDAESIDTIMVLKEAFEGGVIKLKRLSPDGIAEFETKNGADFDLKTNIRNKWLFGSNFKQIKDFSEDLMKLKKEVEEKTFELHKVTKNYRFDI